MRRRRMENNLGRIISIGFVALGFISTNKKIYIYKGNEMKNNEKRNKE